MSNLGEMSPKQQIRHTSEALESLHGDEEALQALSMKADGEQEVASPAADSPSTEHPAQIAAAAAASTQELATLSARIQAGEQAIEDLKQETQSLRDISTHYIEKRAPDSREERRQRHLQVIKEAGQQAERTINACLAVEREEIEYLAAKAPTLEQPARKLEGQVNPPEEPDIEVGSNRVSEKAGKYDALINVLKMVDSNGNDRYERREQRQTIEKLAELFKLSLPDPTSHMMGLTTGHIADVAEKELLDLVIREAQRRAEKRLELEAGPVAVKSEEEEPSEEVV